MRLRYIIIVGVLCLTIGTGLGYSAKKISMEKEKITPEKKDESISALLNIEKSPLLNDITVRLRGEAVKVDENSLLIRKGENSFEAKIDIFPVRIIKIAYDPDSGKKLVGEDLKLEDIKIGDQLRIRCILEGGEWQLEDIVIEKDFPESQE